MNNIETIQIDINRKQASIMKDYRNSQEGFRGFRRLFGNTLIALGDRIHGRAEECREEIARRALTRRLREAA
ncbi:MAG: hypothetical protein M9934_08265 [Thermomicrobiales bacterium]|nr:hypothetical protein [Thermomicrobiales bacterium]MCO5228265.1 hypothetical protein [Thermomicrobiales bacterium]